MKLSQEMYEVWFVRWEAVQAAALAKGGESEPLVVAKKASEDEIVRVEKEIGQPLPISFREVLLNYSSSVQATWSIPDDNDDDQPDTLGVYWGAFQWDLEIIAGLEEGRLGWISDCFPDAEDDFDKVWHNKLPFIHVANGDLIAFDLAGGEDAPVVFLSHDDVEIHGHQLGRNFVDFMERWTILGCPGPENSQIDTFMPSKESMIAPDSPNGLKWRAWFGI